MLRRIGGPTVAMDKAKALYPDAIDRIAPFGVPNLELIQNLVALGLYVDVQDVRYDGKADGPYCEVPSEYIDDESDEEDYD